jgi:ADP-ribose pyrophosphatase YjhB (NUDIX family)
MINFCTQCGSPAAYKIPEHDAIPRAVCPSCGHIEYENPKIIAGTLPVIGDEILLCKRAIEPRKDLWTVPSGFMELNETLEEGALRESVEEAGIEPTIQHLYCIYNLPHIGQVYLLYLATLENKHTDPGYETTEARFFKLDDIPWDDLAFSSVTFALKHYVSDFKTNTFPLRTGSFIKEAS